MSTEKICCGFFVKHNKIFSPCFTVFNLLLYFSSYEHLKVQKIDFSDAHIFYIMDFSKYYYYF